MGLELVDDPAEIMEMAFNAGAAACLAQWQGFDFFDQDTWPSDELPQVVPCPMGFTSTTQDLHRKAYSDGYTFVQVVLRSGAQELADAVRIRAEQETKPNG